MILKNFFLILLVLTLPSKLFGDTDIEDNTHQFKLYLGQNIKLITYFFLFFSFIFCIDSFLKIRLIYFSELGGGIFMKIALLFSIQPSLFLSLFSFLSLVILDFFFQGNKIKNYFLLILLILAFPIFTLYQKYFDPLLLIFFFGLIKSKQIEKTIEDFKKNLSIIYLYFFSFYVFSIFYYS